MLTNRPFPLQEMIADLKNDSARWQAESMRRAEQGYPRGSYIHRDHMSRSPNMVEAHYQNSDTHMGRQQYGPSSPYGPPVGQSIVDPHGPIQYVNSQPPHGSTQSPSYQPQTYTSGNSSFPPNQYVPQMSYPGHGQVPSSSDPPQGYPAYTLSNSPAYYETARNNAPRYTVPGYEPDQDFHPGFSPGTSGGGYPTTSVPDPRADMDPIARYTPESVHDRNNRQQPTRPERRR